MPTVGVYARISLDRHDGEGVARQLDDCRQLAAERWPDAQITEYCDNDLSAFRARRRPEYDRLLADLRAGRLVAVVAYHPDRLYRRLADLEDLIDAVQGAGAEVATVKAGDVDMATASGRMIARILGSVARHESERIGERVSRVKRERAAQGRPAGGGLRPFGLTADRSALVADEADMLRQAAVAVLGGDSFGVVVNRLNDSGVRNTTGRQWTIGNLRRTLCSPHVAGLRSYQGEIVGPATWPPILDRGTWERLRAAAATRRRGRPPSDRHLLTGLLACSKCGRTLWANQRRNRASFEYRCSPAATTTGRGCGALSIAAEPLEQLIPEMIFTAIDNGTLTQQVGRLRRRHDAAPDIDGIEAELAALADDYGAQRITRGEWLKARVGLARRLDDARAAVAAVETGHVVEQLDVELRARWPGLTIDRQRAIIAAVFERIAIRPAKRLGPPPMVEGIGRIDLDRVDIRWRA
jgi:DNA invertase Pin-like site-specific DNA recombinase